MFSLIKSRPKYEGASAHGPRQSATSLQRKGRRDSGAEAVLGEHRRLSAPRPRSSIAATGTSGETHLGDLVRLGPRSCHGFADPRTLLAELATRLTTASMSTRVYAAGTEGFIGSVVRLGIDFGIDHRSVLTEHSGSLARRVQCVHCKGFTENVTVSIFECGHCGNLLFVRDHYSRRLAAFQGVVVNAEEPGSRPQAEEAYL
jgi:predicted RNA-binding Zn-ribbon protein involved in translation (DUF1610 family)